MPAEEDELSVLQQEDGAALAALQQRLRQPPPPPQQQPAQALHAPPGGKGREVLLLPPQPSALDVDAEAGRKLPGRCTAVRAPAAANPSAPFCKRQGLAEGVCMCRPSLGLGAPHMVLEPPLDASGAPLVAPGLERQLCRAIRQHLLLDKAPALVDDLRQGALGEEPLAVVLGEEVEAEVVHGAQVRVQATRERRASIALPCTPRSRWDT